MIDVVRYLRLPLDVQDAFDAWLRAEHLVDKRIVQLTLGEGVVRVVREDMDEHGRAYLDDNREIATIVEEYPVRTLPPVEAFKW